MMTLSVAAIGSCSAFNLHDLKRVQDGLETNYISATPRHLQRASGVTEAAIHVRPLLADTAPVPRPHSERVVPFHGPWRVLNFSCQFPITVKGGGWTDPVVLMMKR
jgi:hypothetical protein